MKHSKTFMLLVPWMVPGGADRCGVDMLQPPRVVAVPRVGAAEIEEEPLSSLIDDFREAILSFLGAFHVVWCAGFSFR